MEKMAMWTFSVALSEVAIFLGRVTRRGRKKPKGKFDKTRDYQSHHCGNLSGLPLAFFPFLRAYEAEVVGDIYLEAFDDPSFGSS